MAEQRGSWSERGSSSSSGVHSVHSRTRMCVSLVCASMVAASRDGASSAGSWQHMACSWCERSIALATDAPASMRSSSVASEALAAEAAAGSAKRRSRHSWKRSSRLFVGEGAGGGREVERVSD